MPVTKIRYKPLDMGKKITPIEDAGLRPEIRAAGVPAVSKISKVPSTTIQSYLDGKSKNMRSDNMKAVERALAVLAHDAGTTPTPEVAFVPMFDIRASAGAGALVEDGEPSDFQPYRFEQLSRYNIEDLVVIQVGGDSMWDTLHDGDLVMLDRSVDRIVKQGIYIIRFEGELLVKRCQRNFETGTVIVESDNKDYKTFEVGNPDVIDVLGRVVQLGRFIG